MVKAEQAPGAKTSAESGSEWQEGGPSLEIGSSGHNVKH